MNEEWDDPFDRRCNEWGNELARLVERMSAEGYVPTVEQVAMTPLAMGNYFHRIHVRKVVERTDE